MTNALLDSVVALDGEDMRLLVVLRLLADENGVVRMGKPEIASTMRCTVQTLNKRLTHVKKYAAVDSVGHVHVAPVAVGAETSLSSIFVPIDSNRIIDSKETGVKIDADAVINRFIARYTAKYPDKPRIDWRVARNSAKAFIRRHGERSLDVIDAAFDNYDTTWRRPAYPRPSFGAMMSWLGEEAAAYVDDKAKKGEKIDVEAMV
jgi:hypothetical protein